MKRNFSLRHTVWDCKYHVVWIPKYRRKVLYGKLRNYLGEVFHELARQRESRIIEGDLCIDHIHMCIAIPPKYSVSEVVGYIKGKKLVAAGYFGIHIYKNHRCRICDKVGGINGIAY